MNITIVIPTHNRKTELIRAAKSVFEQTFLPKEVIVIDDGSTEAITENMFANIPEEIAFKILRNEKPQGANNARNRGVQQASSNWIAFLDDDDEFMPTKIEKVACTIDEFGQKADIIYHPAEIIMVNEDVSYTTSPQSFDSKEKLFEALLVKNCIGGTPMVVVKKSKFLEVGLFDCALNSLEDYELWLRLAKKNAGFRFLDKVLTRCHYTTKQNSISKSIAINDKSLKYIENKYKQNYEKLDPREQKLREIWKRDLQIHKSYLNKNYSKALVLNFKSLLKLKKPKYLFGFLASILGLTAVFKLRALKG